MLNRRYLLVLTCLLALTLIGSAVTAVDKGGGDLQMVGPDPNSTFTVGSLFNVFPLTTVQVPLYLDTPNDPTYIQNRISWTDSDLTLLGVVPGNELPGTATLTIEEQTTTEVQFNIWDNDNSLNVTASVPYAYLEFQVLCYGYGVITNVVLVNDDDENWYDSDGNPPLAPLRENGTVRTKYETLGGALYGTGYTAMYAGDLDVPWYVNLYQEVPGRLLDAVIAYDHTLFEVASVVPEPGLGGGSVDIVSDENGVLELELNGNPFMGPGDITIFSVHFNALGSTDDVMSPVQITAGTREFECGQITQGWWLMWGGNLNLLDHTAAADIGVTQPYYTASYYDVPVLMDSSYPVNTYKLFINFPNDDITFSQVVAKPGFLAPIGDVNQQDPGEVIVTNSSGTNYQLSGLTTVFYLRFTPNGSFPSGTQFDLTFDQVLEEPETEIRYLMDIGGFHNADITDLTPGYILLRTPPPPPNPCCPALFTWNGRGFELDNNILAECDGKKVENTITEYYHVTRSVVPQDDVLRFQIRENANAVSTFENFELLVVDHPEDRDIQVTKDGRILTQGQAFSVSWARDYKGRDITELINSRDEVVYQATEDGWFDVSLGVLSKKQIGDITAYRHDALDKSKICDDDQLRARGIELRADRKLRVSVQNADGGWQLISENDARHNPNRQVSTIDPDLIDPGREVILRYSWESHYRTDVVEFYAAAPFEGEIASPRLWDVAHSETGMAAGRPDADPMTLIAGEAIELVFDASELPRVERGMSRDYIFVTTGKYEEPGAAEGKTPAREWALDANVPNPFNPTTTINYNLANDTYVELSVYDVSGALVRSLVAAQQTAGEKSVTWDGRSNAGEMMASGVYFYRLSTREFVETRKMTLLK